MEKRDQEREFIEMIRQYERTIYKVCLCYTSPEQPLADLYQEAVCHLWAGFRKFRQECSLSTWVYRVTLNTCLTGIRKTIRRPVYTPLVPDLVRSLAEGRVEENEKISEMYDRIHRLGRVERTIVLLYLEEKSYREIAEITGLTLCNVATKLKRAKERLKHMMNR